VKAEQVTGASRRLDTLASASKEAAALRRARRSEWTKTTRPAGLSARARFPNEPGTSDAGDPT
jgi:hypothetical protein